MTAVTPVEPTAQHAPFAASADEATITRTADALRSKGYDVLVVEDRAAAKAAALGLVPEGAEVSQGASKTLEELGIAAEIDESGRYDAVRARTRAMDRSTAEGLRAMRKLGASPDIQLNSAAAVTEDGTIVVVSNTGSQLAPIAFGAGKVIFVLGSQKIVPDLESAMRRIEEHVLPLENARMQGIYGVDSAVNKVLIVNREFRSGRFAVVLIKEPIGF